MEMKTALVIALGLAVGLPYVTILLLEGGGPLGPVLITALFLGVLLLVVRSDGAGNETADDP